MRKIAAIVIALFALVFGSLQYHAAHASAPPALHVSGSTLVDSNNVPVRLHGVNFSGAEYSCTNSGTVWDTTGAVPSAVLGASDGVYFELTYQDTTGVPYDSVTLYESSSSIAGIMSEVQITTPPFIAG